MPIQIMKSANLIGKNNVISDNIFNVVLVLILIIGNIVRRNNVS